MKFQY